MKRSMHRWLTGLVLGGAVLTQVGCQVAAPPPAPPRVVRGGGDEPFYATPVPEDEPVPQSRFSRIATNTTTRVARFFAVAADAPIKLYTRFHGDKPSTAARKVDDETSADNRRQGINELLQYKFAYHDPYVRHYREISKNDPSPLVRETALRASNRVRDESATPIFVKSLSDESPLVRLEACKALVNLPEMDAVRPLLAILQRKEEERDVRIAAADALKHYRTPAVGRALVSMLSERDFGIAWQSRQSLRYLTGVDFRFDEGQWLTYFAGPDKPLG